MMLYVVTANEVWFDLIPAKHTHIHATTETCTTYH